MDRWDLLLLFFAAYVAATSLVRMMADHRNKLTAQIRQHFEAHRSASRLQPRQNDEQDAA